MSEQREALAEVIRGSRPVNQARTAAEIEECLLLRSERDPETGCLRWMGTKNRKGYGYIRFGGRGTGVHRVAYEVWVGPIGEGLEIDHVRDRGCAHRDCIEPSHLEAVTHAENVARKLKRPPMHCPAGHEYTSENTLTGVNGRGYPSRCCRICKNQRQREYRAERGAR